MENTTTQTTLDRTFILSEIKRLGIETPRPAHTMKTADLADLLPKPKDPVMKDRILELHLEGVSNKDIYTQMKETEGFARLRQPYVGFVIKNYKLKNATPVEAEAVEA